MKWLPEFKCSHLKAQLGAKAGDQPDIENVTISRVEADRIAQCTLTRLLRAWSNQLDQAIHLYRVELSIRLGMWLRLPSELRMQQSACLAGFINYVNSEHKKDAALRCASPDPSDPAVTYLVMTLILAEKY
jgi:hypothetical protein